MNSDRTEVRAPNDNATFQGKINNKTMWKYNKARATYDSSLKSPALEFDFAERGAEGLLRAPKPRRADIRLAYERIWIHRKFQCSSLHKWRSSRNVQLQYMATIALASPHAPAATAEVIDGFTSSWAVS